MKTGHLKHALPTGLDRIDAAQPQERHQSQCHSPQGLHDLLSSSLWFSRRSPASTRFAIPRLNEICFRRLILSRLIAPEKLARGGISELTKKVALRR
jgi:hypothetical protein